MSWEEKQLKRNKLYREVRQAMKDPRFIAEQEKEQERVLREAFCKFCVISCDYLYRNFGCKKEGLKKYAQFVERQLNYAKDMPGFFRDLNQAMVDELGVDVLGEDKGEF